jgi:AGZA family xanthine/uracil permease-like MFS transporter
MMAKEAAHINWKYAGDAIPAFLTIAIMPFTYSIAYGLITGIISYIVINTLVFVIEKASGGKIIPPEKENKDPWSYKIPGGFFPPWISRAARGKKQFWREDPESIGEDPEAMDHPSMEHQEVHTKTEDAQPKVSGGSSSSPVVDPEKVQEKLH